MTLGSIGRSLWKHWYVVIACAVLFAAIAAAVTLREPASYTAQTRVYAPDSASLPTVSLSGPSRDRQVLNALELLRTEEIPAATLTEADIDMEPAGASSRISLSQVPDTDIIVVAATAPTDEMATALVESAAEHYAAVLNAQTAEQIEQIERVLESQATSTALPTEDLGVVDEATGGAVGQSQEAASISADTAFAERLADLLLNPDGLRSLLNDAWARLALAEGTSRVVGPTTVAADVGGPVQSGLLGSIVGALFGALVAVALGYVRVPVDAIGEIGEITGMTVLGRVDEGSTTARDGGTPDARVEMIATSLLGRVAAADLSAVVLVPAVGTDGIEQIAQDMARGLAAQGEQIALIDASSSSAGEGVAQLGDSGSEVASVAEGISVGTGHISVLSPGSTPVPFASWLGSKDGGAALATLHECCALSMFVAPPLHRDASGLLIAAHIGAVVLVIPETTTRSRARTAAEEIRRMDLPYAEVLVVSGS